MPKWLRVGDFFQQLDHKNRDHDPINMVKFRNFTHSALVREIVVIRFPSQLQLILEGTGFCQQELAAGIKKFFFTYEYGTPQGLGLGFIFRLRSYAQKAKFARLFRYFNSNYEYELFTPEIFAELQQIFDYLAEIEGVYKHLVPEFSSIFSHTDPAREQSTALYDFLFGSLGNKTFDLKKLKQLLLQGEDPNQYNKEKKDRALDVARHFSDKDIFKLLIFYGGKFMEPDREHHLSVFQNAKKYDEADNLAIMIAIMSVLERPVSERPGMRKIYFHSDVNQVMTVFHFSNNEVICSRITNPQALPPQERTELFDLFAQFFECAMPDSGKTLAEIFSEELSGANKFLEILYHRGRIIGFNLFEMVFPRRHPDHVVLHLAFALIRPEYRGSGLMDLLAWRLAYCLQLMMKKMTVGVFFCALHYNSIRLIKYKRDDAMADFYLHFPKHQPAAMSDLIKDILDKVCAGVYELYLDDMTCYIRDKVKVKGPYASGDKPDFFRDMFYKYIFNIDPAKPQTSEKGAPAVPVLYIVGDENTFNMTKLCAGLGFSFAEHIDELTRHAAPFLDRVCKEEQSYGSARRQQPWSRELAELWRSSRHHFWNAIQGNTAPVRDDAHRQLPGAKL